MTIKKGDRVEWIQGPETKYGVVFRGGKRPTVYVDGGIHSVKGAAGAFSLSNHPLPADEPSVMDKWDVKSYKDYGMGEETAHFQATITLNGKVVIYARNQGCGGCNMYTPIYGGVDRSILDDFAADAKAWGEQFGSPYDFEMTDTWLDWAANEKIYGKKAVDYFKKMTADHKAMMGG